MKKEKIIYLPIGILTGLTAVSAVALAGNAVLAATDTGTATASVTVGSACSFTSDSDHDSETGIYEVTSFDETPGPGITSIGDGGSMVISCNDAGGFAIYAVGSNDTGNNADINKLIFNNTTNSQYSIGTGTVTGGENSSWSFRLTQDATTSSTANGVVGSPVNYGNYASVPASYDKVFDAAGATSGLTTATVHASYKIYISQAQAAGTYTGGVKYTLVHPHSAAAPAS